MEESKKVPLKCNVCGGTNFEFDDELDEATAEYKCTQCNKVYKKDELIQVNQGIIESAGIELAEDMMKKALKKSGFKIK